ncbi:MAG: hypothetical protein KatS3mg125_0681 [Lysobacterales bacterium]|jgi:TRAP-type mannitol/chloroaromatic compound transport system permease small subunit|nr:MAG: hypothetical protein KatS3mg125_0681 [Xanthomonadales bacterium]
MRRLALALDGLEDVLSGLLAFLASAMVLLVFAVVVLRYGFGLGSVALQELAQHLHAAIFLLAASIALRCGRHVRVDLFYGRLAERAQRKLDAFANLAVVLPFAVFAFLVSLDYVSASFAIREASREPGGLPALWLVKGLIPAFALLLGLRALTEGLRALASLRR